MQYEYGSLGQYVLSNMDGATAPWMRYRLMVVGKDRVGKTSLLKSLRRERFNKKEKSTQVADVNQVRIEDAKVLALATAALVSNHNALLIIAPGPPDRTRRYFCQRHQE